jgi:hypothetical protein
MTEYMVKLGFWVRAHDSVTIEAADDSEAIRKAKTAAKIAMASGAYPEAIDTGERREGIIAFIDRLDPDGREAVAEGVAFDHDRIHRPLHDFVMGIAAQTTRGTPPIPDCTDATCHCRTLAAEARKLLDAGAQSPIRYTGKSPRQRCPRFKSSPRRALLLWTPGEGEGGRNGIEPDGVERAPRGLARFCSPDISPCTPLFHLRSPFRLDLLSGFPTPPFRSSPRRGSCLPSLNAVAPSTHKRCALP